MIEYFELRFAEIKYLVSDWLHGDCIINPHQDLIHKSWPIDVESHVRENLGHIEQIPHRLERSGNYKSD